MTLENRSWSFSHGETRSIAPQTFLLLSIFLHLLLIENVMDNLTTEILTAILWSLVRGSGQTPNFVYQNQTILEVQTVSKRIYDILALPAFRTSYGLTTQSSASLSTQVVQAISWFEKASKTSPNHPLQLSLTLLEVDRSVEDTFPQVKRGDMTSVGQLLDLYAKRWECVYLDRWGFTAHFGEFLDGAFEQYTDTNDD